MMPEGPITESVIEGHVWDSAPKMRWLAVRCCCQPQKVIGFYAVEEGVLGKNRTLRVLQMADSWDYHPDAHTFEIAHLSLGAPRRAEEYAIKSENVGLEFWRRVHGFVEAAR